MMIKNSVKVYFTSEGSDGTKRNFSRTVNYVNGDASEGDLAEFRLLSLKFLANRLLRLRRSL